jgi:hypothetical protein
MAGKTKVVTPKSLSGRRLPLTRCNCTRLDVKPLRRNIIEATILTEFEKLETVFVPRIPLIKFVLHSFSVETF